MVVGHMRSLKEFPCYQSVARDSATTSAGSHWTANHASRPWIPARILQQFAKLEVPTGIVTKAVTSHQLKVEIKYLHVAIKRFLCLWVVWRVGLSRGNLPSHHESHFGSQTIFGWRFYTVKLTRRTEIRYKEDRYG